MLSLRMYMARLRRRRRTFFPDLRYMSVLRLIHRPLSDDDLRHILGSGIKIIKYSQLSEYDDLGTLLPKPVDCCIILYEEKLDSGHWTALSRYAGRYEHFDSYGVAPDSELRWVNLTMRARLNERTPYLSNLLKKESYIYNTVPYQSKEHDVNTCGAHVAHRLYCLQSKGMQLAGYHSYMEDLKRESQSSYDYIVAEFVRGELSGQ